jgi:hypothetical protein
MHIPVRPGIAVVAILVTGFALGFVVDRISWQQTLNYMQNLVSTVQQVKIPILSDSRYRLRGALVLQEGSVDTKNPLSLWVPLEKGATITEGMVVRTGESSRAVVELDDGSAVRMDENSEIRFSTLSDEIVLINQYQGIAYHRVHPGNIIYNVKSLDTLATAIGTDFDVSTDQEIGKTEVSVYDSKVEVSVKGENTQKKEIIAGQKASIKEYGESITVLGIPPTQREKKFYKWNESLNKKETTVTPTPAASLSPLPSSKPTESIQLTSPVIAGTVNCTGMGGDEKVALQWTLSGSAPYGYKVIQSTQPEPVYPPRDGDHFQYFSSQSDTKYTWEGLPNGKTYHFRVGIYDGNGHIVSYSNNVSVTLPAKDSPKTIVTEQKPTTAPSGTSVSLTGKSENAGKVTLSWTVNGEVPNGFKTCWADHENPSYPDDQCQWIDSETKQYTWEVDSGKTYHFRVGIYIGSDDVKVSSYSNDIAVTSK